MPGSPAFHFRLLIGGNDEKRRRPAALMRANWAEPRNFSDRHHLRPGNYRCWHGAVASAVARALAQPEAPARALAAAPGAEAQAALAATEAAAVVAAREEGRQLAPEPSALRAARYPCLLAAKEGVDDRDKRGHDDYWSGRFLHYNHFRATGQPWAWRDSLTVDSRSPPAATFRRLRCKAERVRESRLPSARSRRKRIVRLLKRAARFGIGEASIAG
jgi:hypothetical protein